MVYGTMTMKHIILFLSSLLLSSVNAASAFEQPSADEYFQVWIKDYRSIVAGDGPVPVEFIENTKPVEPLTGNKKNYDKYFKKNNNQLFK